MEGGGRGVRKEEGESEKVVECELVVWGGGRGGRKEGEEVMGEEGMIGEGGEREEWVEDREVNGMVVERVVEIGGIGVDE